MSTDELRTELRDLMDRENITPAAVAVAIDVSEKTVRRFLCGEGNHRITLRALREFISSKVSNAERKVANG